jgi:hypothetical protein
MITDPILCPHRQIRITVPRAKLRKLFYHHSSLNPQQSAKLRTYLAKIDNTINQINHVRSVVDKILLRE